MLKYNFDVTGKEPAFFAAIEAVTALPGIPEVKFATIISTDDPEIALLIKRLAGDPPRVVIENQAVEPGRIGGPIEHLTAVEEAAIYTGLNGKAPKLGRPRKTDEPKPPKPPKAPLEPRICKRCGDEYIPDRRNQVKCNICRKPLPHEPAPQPVAPPISPAPVEEPAVEGPLA